MRSVAIARIGGPEVLEVRSSPDPAPGRGQVRVRARAVGVNFADILMRMGLYPGAPKTPFVPGYEAAGVIDAVGPEAGDWSEGDRVLVPINFGGYSDTLVVPADQAFRIPEGRSFQAAAALPVNYLTAYMAVVEHGHLRKGGRVLIHGAAGGVGIAAVQIARIFDAEIFGTASASKHDYLRAQGVRHCIDYRAENFEDAVRRLTGGKGVHLVLDPIGGESFARSYRSLAPTGKLIIYGMSAAATGPTRNLLGVLWQLWRTPRFSPLDLMSSNKGVVGVHMGRLPEERELFASMMSELLGWWAQGKIDPVVGTTFPLELAGRAHEFIQDRKNIGKVVLTVE